MSTSYPQLITLKRNYSSYLTLNNFSKSSIKNYVSDVTVFIRWIQENENSGTDIYSYLDKNGQSAVLKYRNSLSSVGTPKPTINRKLASLRHFSVYLFTTGATNTDLMQNVSNIHLHPIKKNNPLIIEYTRHLKSRGFSKNTVKNYTSDINSFFAWLNLLAPSFLPDISEEEANPYYEVLNHTKFTATKKRKLSSLNNFFEWAMTRGISNHNPFSIDKQKKHLESIYINKVVPDPVVLEPISELNNMSQITLDRVLFPIATLILIIINIYLASPQANTIQTLGTNNINTVSNISTAPIANTEVDTSIDSQDNVSLSKQSEQNPGIFLTSGSKATSAMGLNLTADSSLYSPAMAGHTDEHNVDSNDNNLDSMYIVTINNDGFDNASAFLYAENQEVNDYQHGQITVTQLPSPDQNSIYNSIGKIANTGVYTLLPTKSYQENTALSPEIDSRKSTLTYDTFETQGGIQKDIIPLDSYGKNENLNPLPNITNNIAKYIFDNIISGLKFTSSAITSQIASIIGLPHSYQDVDITQTSESKVKLGTAGETGGLTIRNTRGKVVTSIDPNNRLFGSNLTRNKITEVFYLPQNVADKLVSTPAASLDDKLFTSSNLENPQAKLQMEIISHNDNSESDLKSQDIANQDKKTLSNAHQIISWNTQGNEPESIYIQSFDDFPTLVTSGKVTFDANGNLIVPSPKTL